MSIYERRVLTTTDRTHWTDPSGATVLPSTSITFNSNKKYYFTEPLALDIIDGNDYEVTWSGERYNAPAATMTAYGEECVYLGNKTGLSSSPDLNQGSFLLIVLPESMRGQGYVELIALDNYSSANVEIVCVSENVHFLDKKYLANANGDMAHKMLITDGNEKAKWEERTHYAYQDMVYLLPETTFLAEQFSGGAADIKTSIVLEENKTYTVTYNGVDYECAPTITQAKPILEQFGVTVDESVMGGILGNLAPLAPELATDEPFVLMVFQGVNIGEANGFICYGLLMPLDEVSEYVTLSIRGVGEAVKQLDMKYLPDKVKNANRTVNIYIQENGSAQADITFKEAWEMDINELQKAIVIHSYNGKQSIAAYAVAKETNPNYFDFINIQYQGVTDLTIFYTQVLAWAGKIGDEALENTKVIAKLAQYQTLPQANVGGQNNFLYSYDGRVWQSATGNEYIEAINNNRACLNSIDTNSSKKYTFTIDDEKNINIYDYKGYGNPNDDVAIDSIVKQSDIPNLIPTMSSTVKGGAMVGEGLEVVDGYLNVKPISSDRINEICGSTTA